MRISKKIIKLVSIALLAGVTASCGAEFHSIHRIDTLPSGVVTTQFVDAKQRMIITVPGKQTEETTSQSTSTATINGTTRKAHLMVCAEPGPDVFSVTAASGSGNASFGQSETPGQLSVAAALSLATSEQAATIGHTQTINMLREVMYRTCERYINDGMGPLELATQASRDQRLIIAALAIEQLTGAIIAKPTIIAAGGNGSGGAAASDAVIRVDDAAKAKQAADNKAKTSAAAYDALNKDKACEAVLPADADQAKKDAKATCEKAKATKDADAASAKTATEYYDTLKKALDSGGGLVTQAAATFSDATGNGGLQQATATNVAAIAEAIRGIVSENYATDEFELLCIKIFDRSTMAENLTMSAEGKARFSKDIVAQQSVQDSCIAYFNARLEKRRAEDAAQTAELIRFVSSVESGDGEAFDKLWAKVSANNTLDTAVLKTLVNAAIAQKPKGSSLQPLKNLATSKTRTELRKNFGTLPNVDRNLLIK